MGVKDSFLFIILPVNLQKVRTKIVDNRFVVIGSIAERRDAAYDAMSVETKR
jgi:hypothetical protein